MSTSENSGKDEDLDASSSVSCVRANVVTDSALRTMPNDFRVALDDFRNNWKSELRDGKSDTRQLHIAVCDKIKQNAQECNEMRRQTLAESLFRKAVELEECGKVYDALPLYRKAVQMVPDIELKFYDQQKTKAIENLSTDINDFTREKISPTTDNEANDMAINLYEKFQLEFARNYEGKFLLGNRATAVVSTEIHISDLPPEILLKILRWVVSVQLDMRSLEQCAAVCRGFYLCARDEEIWRVACLKIWGGNVGTLDATTNSDETAYTSWRQMFIERERVLFNGCYISKTTYLRMGENSFQDQYYRPVQLVEYYRYLRFFPDGKVLMMTNADEPSTGVTRLRNMKQLRADILCGHYHLCGNTVAIMLYKQQTASTVQQYSPRYRRVSSAMAQEPNITKYCITLRIVNTSRRKFAQLLWLNYSLLQIRNRIETVTKFDLTHAKYPPLWFSPVRSYDLDADEPLD